MSLSIHKLLQILDKSDMYASKYYCKDHICMYINIISKINGNEYMLYVPSKYNISLKDIKNNVFELKSFDVSKKNKELLSEYGNYNQDINNEMGNNVISENTLMKNYKNNPAEQEEYIKRLNRHLKRMKYIVKSSDYKVVVQTNNILGCINKNNDILFYNIKNFDEENTNKYLVCMTLEIFYKNFENINKELSNTKNNITSILDKNYDKNINYIHSLLTKTNIDTSKLNNHIMTKKRLYHTNVKQLNDLLKSINEKENDYKVHIENGNTSIIEKYKELLKTKSNILLEIISNINKLDNITILCDKILFDNIILVNQLTKNIELFDNI